MDRLFFLTTMAFTLFVPLGIKLNNPMLTFFGFDAAFFTAFLWFLYASKREALSSN